MPERASSRLVLCATLIASALLELAGCSGPSSLEDVRVLQEVTGDYAASVEPLRKLLEERPDDPELAFRYGLALVVTEEPELAKWSLRKAMESDEWFEKSGAALARAMAMTGDHDDAAEICTRLLERRPDDIETLLVRAEAYIGSRRNYELALADAERVLEIDPDNVGALVPRTAALLALERVDEANEALEQLESLYRDESLGLHGSAGFCTARATFAKEKGETELAAERYDSCLELFPSWEPLVEDAVEFFDGLDRKERAQEILERAVEANPGNGGLRIELALRLHGQGETDRAKEVMRAGTRDPASAEEIAEGWAALGSFLLELGEFGDAAEALGRARVLDPTASPNLLFAYADAAVVAGHYDQALRLADSITVPAHRELIRGRVALSQREPRKALAHFSEGIRLWPNNAFARYYAAVAAEQAGNFERAIEEYRYAMRIEPAGTDAYLRLARLHAAAGRPTHALTALGFMPGNRPREEEAWQFELELVARLGRAPKKLERPADGVPQERWSAGLAAIARGVRDRDGPAAADKYLRRHIGSMDFGDRANAPVLEVWIECLAASKRAGEAVSKVDAALKGHSDVAILHALRGRALQLAGSDAERVRAAFDRALELDPKEPRALRGLADLAAARGANDEALALYERALAADPDSPATTRSAARMQLALGKTGEAEERLAALLRDHPYDAEAALVLAEQYAARGPEHAAHTRELARRAVMFGGGPKAKAFLDKLRAEKQPAATVSKAAPAS